MTSSMKTYHGSCHCGAVRFEADIDLARGTLRCNCSICLKARFWPAIVQPDAFRLLAGAAELTEYRFLAKRDQHLFCRHCGVRPFVIGRSPRWGEFYGVNVTCLDDATAEELANAPITYLDGKNDDWETPPVEIGHL
ncbi:GFA family protein [Pseudoduganella sp. SL102]|uniref:GFA family protein n=1 Tax=Pseudoduganella sp. SL102 TaxID=2995154 RepID=UPI00248AB203|nr:GFA family protein [Pseudoduganella sp. SL102]WBS04924.1 GFA family protein [Pseudoduganella sp. SL102]